VPSIPVVVMIAVAVTAATGHAHQQGRPHAIVQDRAGGNPHRTAFIPATADAADARPDAAVVRLGSDPVALRFNSAALPVDGHCVACEQPNRSGDQSRRTCSKTSAFAAPERTLPVPAKSKMFPGRWSSCNPFCHARVVLVSGASGTS